MRFPSLSSLGDDLPSQAEDLEALGLAPEGCQLIDLGLSAEIVDRILSLRALSTRKMYVAKWQIFVSWYEVRQSDPVQCLVGTVLEFLKVRSCYHPLLCQLFL